MAIYYSIQNRTFTIHTTHTTYQMQVDRFGFLLHLYYGQRTEGCMDYLLTYADRGFSGNPYESREDRTYSPDYLPQEFPVQGNGDCRSPLLIVRDRNGTFGANLRYTGYELTRGKYSLSGLPAVYSESLSDGAETLRIHLEDSRLGLKVTLLYGVLPDLDIITRSAIVTNRGTETFTLEKVQTACLDFVTGEYDLITFHGRHMMERQFDRHPLSHGAFSVGSRRGTSSHQYNPFVILADRTATETAGRCWSMQFVYSGGFSAEAEYSQYQETRLQMGLAAETFSWPLSPGESFTAPEVILSFSAAGFERLSHNLHRCIRQHVCRGKYRDMPRPILLNSWEAFGADFTGETILGLADQAKDLGIEMLVLDDGWFGNRYDDNRALGDWQTNEEKLGMSLGELIRNINEKGIRFGIWMEPEMVSEDSSLYRAHPDWALQIPGQKPVMARNQLVLDFSRKDVRDAIFEAICSVLDQGSIEYLKWDFNRSIVDVFSHQAAYQGRVLHDFVLGLYDMLERLSVRYPDLLIEGCSGGGGRFDAGMLYYTPQIWCSDNTDALDRLIIQHGTSFGYPSCTVCAHVSASPNPGTGRRLSLKTRGTVAMSGAFGYELDPAQLSPEEKAEIREQVKTCREQESLIRTGLYCRLTDTADGNVCAWEYVSEDGTRALISAVLRERHGNMPDWYIIPRHLTPGAFYRDRESGRIYPADALMDTGLPLPRDMESGGSAVLFLERIPREQN